MKNIFTKHPNSVGESYFQHCFTACRFGFKLIGISIRVFIHAVFPFLYESGASKRVDELNRILQDRSRKAKGLDEN